MSELAHTRRGLWSARAIVAWAFLILLFVLCHAGLSAAPAGAHCVPGDKLDTLSIGADRFRNFDFNSNNDDRCNVDWPINFLFWNSASVGEVKNKMEPVGYDNEGDAMYARLDDGNGWDWDHDKGRKNFTGAECVFGDMEHFRVFGAIYQDQSMYNLSWGHYVLATSHIDHHECSGGWSGESETAEGRIAEDARDAGGFGDVDEDATPFYNHLPYEIAGDGHHKQNGGEGTTVKVN